MTEYLPHLKELRIEKNLAQKDVADILGITVSAYSFYENGKREPNITSLKKLASFYNVTLDYLIGLDEDSRKVLTPIEYSFYEDSYTEEQIDRIREYAEFVKLRSLKKIIEE